MRNPLLPLVLFLVTLVPWVCQPVYAQVGTGQVISASVSAQDSPSAPKGVNVDINVHHGGRWYANPVYIGLGVLAFVVLVLLIVMAARGGGTTVIKE